MPGEKPKVGISADRTQSAALARGLSKAPVRPITWWPKALAWRAASIVRPVWPENETATTAVASGWYRTP